MSTEKKTGGDLATTAKKEIDISTGEPTFEGRYFSFAADIIADDDAVTVIADTPGPSAQALEIDLRDNTLTIMGRTEPPPPEWRLIHGEYELGGYMRKFNVGPAIDQEKISAKMQDGVLNLKLAKADRLKPRKIDVQVS